MSGQSLTSLREVPSSLIPQSPQTSHEKEEVQLGEIRSETTTLTRTRDSLKEEVDKLNRSVAFTKDSLKSDTEVKRLRVEKATLLKQIKSIAGAVYKARGYQDSLARGLSEFGEDHIAFLNSLSRVFKMDIEASSAKLTKRSEEITRQEEFLTGLSEYLGEYARICEATGSQNALQRTQIEKMGNSLSKREENIKEEEKRAEELIAKADAAYDLADSKLKEIDKISGWFEKEADKERTSLEQLKIRLDIQSKEIAANVRGIISQKEALRKIERKLTDKEKTLGRVYEEIRAKAKKVGIVL